jgi:hypothetical protein
MENPFTRFEERRISREAERHRLRRRLVELESEGQKDVIAIEQLKAIYPEGFPAELKMARVAPQPDSIEPAPENLLTLSPRANKHSYKDVILSTLQDAPAGLSAAQIKGRAFLKHQVHINPNTLTVTLVRLSKGDAPLVKFEDRAWHYLRFGTQEVSPQLRLVGGGDA